MLIIDLLFIVNTTDNKMELKIIDVLNEPVCNSVDFKIIQNARKLLYH